MNNFRSDFRVMSINAFFFVYLFHYYFAVMVTVKMTLCKRLMVSCTVDSLLKNRTTYPGKSQRLSSN